ncbi:EAL domain-containing protein [Microbulbifer sp. 2205BS26-8]|uniref:GGDEF/EAL domain-containing response regulator n=1 Tax=Microbulbifer sp. 2205BS26-8 TaxID=3064386 RepID=UPI00273F5543|nr:EAL domain-containing protein [Microbulbifer sp. 2205BS26-8]MDP5210433.1 EAL domain-containing protein [Microbulbifer sp. 2205BS26-8]
MSSNDTIRLLLIHDTPSEAQRLVSMLHNAGRPNRAQHVTSEAVLTRLLQDKTWDLIIVAEGSTQVPPTLALRTISKLQKDVPLIILTERSGCLPVVEGLRLGARDVVTVDEDQHLLLVIQRELLSLDNRRRARLHDRRYHATLRRTRELLDSSKDAFAYVSDGLIIYANDSFAEYFGYASGDEAEYQPIIDMLAENEGEEARQFLKRCAIDNNEVEAREWQFTARSASGSGPLPVRAEVLSTTYEEERCLQVRIAAHSADTEHLEAQLSDIKNRDPLTGLFNRQHFLQLLDSTIQSAADSHSTGGLMFIQVARFEEEVQKVVGVAGADALQKAMAELLRSCQRSGDTLACYSDDSFCLLTPDTTPDSAEQRAREMLKKVSDTIFDAAGKTLQITVCIGISLLSEASSGAQQVLEQALVAHRQALGADSGEGSFALYEPNTDGGADVETYHRARVVQALEAGNLKLLYQPILSLQGTGEQMYEVLVRMLDNKVELAPLAFLQELGDAGLSAKMDRWVILTAIKAAAFHVEGKKVSLMLHITTASLLDNSLPGWLAVAFKAARVSPGSVVFQMRQEDITSNLHAAKDFTSRVQQLGCRVAVCHFGTGLNPFKALEHVKVDIAKVDPSFVREVQDEGESSASLAGLVKRLGELDTKVIVPHIEQASMLPTLWQTGTDYIQGYYVQAPAEDMRFDFNLD